MYAGDEFYDDDITSGPITVGDPREYADWLRDTAKNAFACQTCGHPEPAVIEGRYCNECVGENHQRFLDARLTRLFKENVA